jgi:SAM-dependent methyltransferase
MSQQFATDMTDTTDTLMRRVRRQLGAIPLVGAGLKSLGYLPPSDTFRSSPTYWESRYRRGGSSGVGSYGRLARFKAEVINRFVAEHGVASVVEFGCGDGAQLELAEYPRYTGFDISPHIIELCRCKFAEDQSKKFHDLDSGETDTVRAEMAMSLDVIYHLVEDSVYEAYMRRLAAAATRFICVYSSNAGLPGHVPHIRHRRFTDWFEAHAPEWMPGEIVRNPFPHDPANPDETSWADFYFFSRAGS